MSAAAVMESEEPVDMAVARLLAGGLSYAAVLATERRVHQELRAEKQWIDTSRAAAEKSPEDLLAGGRRAMDERTRTLRLLSLRAQVVEHRIDQVAKTLTILAEPATIARSKARDATADRDRKARISLLDQAEEHLRQAAAAVRQAGLHEALLRGAVQRFGDHTGVAWTERCISPAVRQRFNESLAEIFAGGRRPDPPRAA